MPAEQFRLKPDTYQITKKILYKRILGFAIVTPVALTLIMRAHFNEEEGIASIVTPVVIVAGTLVYTFYNLLRREKKSVAEYLLVIGDNSISCFRYGVKPVDLSFLEVRRIFKTADNGYMISGGVGNQVIIVPPYIGQPDRLEQRLNAIMPIQLSPAAKRWTRYRWIFTLLLAPAVLAFMTSTDKRIVIPTGIATVTVMVVSFAGVQRSKYVSRKIKRLFWLLALPLAAMIGRLITVLMGNP